VEGVSAVWAPGQGIVQYPNGLGVPLGKERWLVVQVHYNLASSPPAVDQTRIRLKLAASVERQAVFLGSDDLLGTIFGPNPAELAPGQTSVKYSWEHSARDDGLPDGMQAELVALFPHMHARGRKYTFEVAQGGSDYTCQGHVDAWNFNWQRIYDYAAPIPFDADTKYRVTCDYDTSADTAPVLPGWGTRNEMCFVMLMLALPPGASL
jgi:hypothetical protein